MSQLPQEKIDEIAALGADGINSFVDDYEKKADRVLLTRAAMGNTDFEVEAGSIAGKGRIKIRVHLEVLEGQDLIDLTMANVKRDAVKVHKTLGIEEE